MGRAEKIQHVLTMDLSSLEARDNREHSYHHHSKITRSITEYRRFLALKIQLDDKDAKFISPSPLVDPVWRLHILDTRAYEQMQRDIGMTIHHDPDGILDDGARKKRRKFVLTMYEVVFGEEPPREVWEMGGEGADERGRSAGKDRNPGGTTIADKRLQTANPFKPQSSHEDSTDEDDECLICGMSLFDKCEFPAGIGLLDITIVISLR
ncbi:hypothetical protein HDV00_012542 [Rhizophlyctis rosea]|nr:hypothetical protein HDV00_012542 [Rhizophlyctis rosea]